MLDTDRVAFTSVIAALAATFNREPSEALYEGYWLGLRDLPISAVKLAAAKAMHGRKFMPVPVELRELAGELTPEDRAIKAWEIVKQAVRSNGYYATVGFDDPLINATLRNLWGDWAAFDDALERDEEKWIRKDFERVYQSLLRCGISPDAARPLLGWHEKTNRMNGHADAVRPPVQIACGLPALPAMRFTRSAPAQIGVDRARLTANVGAMPVEAKL